LGSTVISISEAERTFQPPDTFPWLYIKHAFATGLGRKTFFMYLEPKERVWLLKCSSISVKRNLKIEANVVVCQCTVCYHVVT